MTVGFINPALMPKLRSEAIRDSAEGAPCTLRVGLFVGKPCASRATTVGCHLPVSGKGVGTKVTDIAIAYGCKVCHDIVDGPDRKARDFINENYPAAYAMRLLNALVETHTYLLLQGIITVKDGEIGK